MSETRPSVVVTRRLPAPVEARMTEIFEVRLNADDHPFTKDELMRTSNISVMRA